MQPHLPSGCIRGYLAFNWQASTSINWLLRTRVITSSSRSSSCLALKCLWSWFPSLSLQLSMLPSLLLLYWIRRGIERVSHTLILVLLTDSNLLISLPLLLTFSSDWNDAVHLHWSVSEDDPGDGCCFRSPSGSLRCLGNLDRILFNHHSLHLRQIPFLEIRFSKKSLHEEHFQAVEADTRISDVSSFLSSSPSKGSLFWHRIGQ